MSSPLHTAKCLSRDLCSVEIEIGPTSAIGVHFPVSDFFGLALLHEAATQIDFGKRGPRARAIGTPALATALTFDELHVLACIERPDAGKAAVTGGFVTRAAYVETRNFTPTVWLRDADGAYRDPAIPSADPRRRAASDDLQRAFDAIADFADHEARAPHATLRIDVTRPQWISHLAIGMQWDVYVFDEAMATLL